ncbi:MAG: hypothetical protein IT373_21470 [Polyangiaceae bacterium]|nr:hypothetical protein [Polyangiaceae bacterium]
MVVALLAGCNDGGGARQDKAPPASAAPASVATHKPASTIILRAANGGSHEIYAVDEHGAHATRLSRPGTDTTYAGTLPGRRVVLAVHGADHAVASLEVVALDGSERRELGALEPGRFARVVQAKADGEVLALELGRAQDLGKSDVVVVRPGAAPALAAENATLVALAAGRVAFMTGGSLRSTALDGSDARTLGADDAEDRVVEVRGERLLLTIHAAVLGDVRVVKIDGSARVDIGTPEADDRPVGFAGDTRVVVTRAAGDARAIEAVGVDGKDARTLAAGTVAAHAIAPTGDVVFSDGAGALGTASAATTASAAPRTLDPAAGTKVSAVKVLGERVFYLGGEGGSTLRTARLDGSGATTLCAEPTWRPFFATVTPDGRAIFYRALVGQLEGGRLYSVKLDGTGLEPLGNDVVSPDGSAFTTPLSDQDFEAVTVNGRIVFEAEFHEGAPHLLVTDGGKRALRLLDRDDLRFVALVE